MRERLLGLLRGAQEAGRSEDKTGGCAMGAVLGTILAFAIADGRIVIEMQRMVPLEHHEILEPNVFEGSLADDESGFSGTRTREGWVGAEGGVALTGEIESTPCDAQRL